MITIYPEISITGKLKDFDSGLRYVRIAISDGNDCTEVIESRERLYSDKGILLAYGANITSLAEVSKTLFKQEEVLSTEYIYNNVGWAVFDTKRVFKANRLFGLNELTANYQGSLKIQPVGSLEAWRIGIIKFAMPQVPLQISIAIGVSAIFEGMFSDELDTSLITHLKGDSSKGKTTFAMLSLSVACSPQSIEGNTFFCGWNSTNNFKISLLRGNFGYPIVFDEISQSNTSSLTNFVYDVANRQERGRLNSDSSQKKVGTWSTTIISTGEESLLEKCNHNKGLLVRVLELDFEKITADAISAESLKSVIVNNYGHVYQKILEFIFNNEKKIEEFKLLYFEKRIQLSKEIGIENELVNRLIKHIAIIILSAEVCSNVLDLDFDIEAIKQELFRAIKEQNKIYNPDEIVTVLNYLNNSYLSNTARYETYQKGSSCPDFVPGHTVGYVKKTDNGLIIYYNPEKFGEVIKDCSIGDKNKILKLLEKGGYLKRDGDHRDKKRIINGNRLRVYEVSIPYDDFC